MNEESKVTKDTLQIKLTRLCGTCILECISLPINDLQKDLNYSSTISYYMLCDIKEPCDFVKNGFERPEQEKLDSMKEQRFLQLKALGTESVKSTLPQEEALYAFLDTSRENKEEIHIEDILSDIYQKISIERTGLVSERLWELLESHSSLYESQQKKDITWLFTMPQDIWEIVRTEMLQCV